MWVLLFGDMMLFAALFATYLNRFAESRDVFATSQDQLHRSLGALNTLILLTSSILVVFATRALRGGRLKSRASPLLVASIGVGLCFVAIKAVEYSELLAAGKGPTTNDFFMYYFVLTGIHLAHVVVGLAVLTALSLLARRREHSAVQIGLFESGACFWHMVDLLWLVIFPLLFLVQ